MIEAAARQSGQSLNEEIIARLESSFKAGHVPVSKPPAPRIRSIDQSIGASSGTQSNHEKRIQALEAQIRKLAPPPR
jgi:hypothetical protein